MDQKETFKIGDKIRYIDKNLEGKVTGYNDEGFALVDFGDYGIVFFRRPDGIIINEH